MLTISILILANYVLGFGTAMLLMSSMLKAARQEERAKIRAEHRKSLYPEKRDDV